ncbi:MAG TPA: DNA glycosylase [Verrucomicrobiae bacterium]|nr:DNA glycosylase [Verrucomicrobiae bacterium]
MHSQINVSDFNLAATLECGQAFRWCRATDGWFEGVVGREIWRLRQSGATLEWEVVSPIPHEPVPMRHDPSPIAIRRYLALDVSLPDITATFPADDDHLRAAVQKHWGLRVLRQEPWECLASFIASSTKQIVQIRQIVAELSRRFGEPLADGFHAFPSVDAIARASHPELWKCKLGFRAKNLLAAARMIDGGKVELDRLPAMAYAQALEELLKLPGVGEKIANCVLLFSCGFDQAFPVDVWVERAVRRLYFPRRKATARQLRDFARSHFGPYAGWAQQYLFFQERTRRKNRE